MQSRFEVKKRKILEQLDAPEDEYQDLSPKGSVDEPIRSLIGDINRLNGLVTTSSCSGRISVFLEGRKDSEGTKSPPETDVPRAGPGGKGGGGLWLSLTHSPVEVPKDATTSHFMAKFGLEKTGETTPSINCRYIHLKFEPMVCMIDTSIPKY